MLCPFDATTLEIVNRSGVEIDWCPSCKGVWLERGELDKLIDQADRASTPLPPPAPAPQYADPRSTERRRVRDDHDHDDRDDDHHDGGQRHDGDGRRPKKRKNLLSEIFDF